MALFGVVLLLVALHVSAAGAQEEGAQDADEPSRVAGDASSELSAVALFDQIEDFVLLGRSSTRTGEPPQERPAPAQTRARREARRGGGRKVEVTGHVKPQAVAITYPESSLIRQVLDAEAVDTNVDARINLGVDFGRIDFEVQGHVVGLFGDQIEFTRGFANAAPGLGILRYQDDRFRYFDLTQVHRDRGSSAILSRFDRLSVGYTGRRNVLRLGRQAVSWGNGFAYQPMDVFNPFSPAAVDTEYKPGDDMLYAQHLLPRGDDVQAVWVVRRDPLTRRHDSDVDSIALKYHGLFGRGEVDVLAARHYGDDLYAVGGSLSVGGAVVRGDVVVADTDRGTTTSAVAGATYSWVWGGKNVTGFFEGFLNGFGQDGRDYSAEALAANPELLERISRFELFTLGRLYAAGSLSIELTPLFILTPNLFVNVRDTSGLLQIVAQNDLAQNMTLQTAIGLPWGDDGTEFGGIPSGLQGFTLGSGPTLFIQLARYF